MIEGWLAETERGGKNAHDWENDRCTECGLLREEAWTLDDGGAAVMTLLWISPSRHVIRARPFPVMLGLRPPRPPSGTAAELYPGVRIGKEPKCPHQLVDWDAG